MASDGRIKRSLGEMNDFVLYMFEEDLAMIEKWPAERFRRPIEGRLFGLWTNSRNPVVHFIVAGDKVPNDYLFLESPEFRTEKYTPKSMFCNIGVWSYEKLTDSCYQELISSISTTAPKLAFLEVEQKSDELLFHPILLTKDEMIYGRIEPLQGQNPFRLPDEPSNLPAGNETIEEANEPEGNVAKLVGAFETAKAGVLEGIKSIVSFGSVVKQDSHTKEPDSTQESQQKPTTNTLSPSQYGFVEVSTCTENDQWYLSELGQNILQTIKIKLEALGKESSTISRDNDTQNLILLFLFDNKRYVIHFPPDFPNSNAELYSTMYSKTGRSYAHALAKLQSKDPLPLVEEIINIVTSR